MTAPSLPSGYDETRHIQVSRPDCHITVGFDQIERSIPRFLIQLHYQTATNPVQWTAIARMDHNKTAATGHDVYKEGLHVDVKRRAHSTVHLPIQHAPLPSNRGIVIRRGAEYLADEARYFIDVYEGRLVPGTPPHWTDGGKLQRNLITRTPLRESMSREQGNTDADNPSDSELEALTLEELSADLAEATETSADVIEVGAEELSLGRPWDCQPDYSEDSKS